MSQWLLSVYVCPNCGRFESTELRDSRPASKECPDCGAASELDEWGGAPMVRNLTARVQAVTTGKSTAYENPNMLDTRPLAEGMSRKEWDAKNRKAQEERRHKQLIDKGLKSRRVIVG